MKGKPGFIPAHTAAVARRRRNTVNRNNADMANKNKQSNGDKAMLQSAVNHALENVPFILFSNSSLAKYEEQKRKVISEYGFLPKRSPTIKDGSVLPRRCEPVPPYFYGKPIEELESGIYEKTFCVISRHFSKHYVNRITATNSFFLFSPCSLIRKTCVALVTNQYFDYVMILTILFNCVFLALTNPIEQAEYVFLSIYTSEMLIKSIAKGFILNKYTYLRNPWNWLDFIVIVLGFVTIFVNLGSLSGLRTFRVLRALKTVSILPGLKTIVNALLHSIKMLSEVMLLTVFCLMVFALFALQIYMGTLRSKCVKDRFMTNMTDQEYFSYVQNSSNWLKEENPNRVSYINCGNSSGTYQCDANYTCLPDIGDNPNYGYTSFDNFGSAMLNTFQLITLDYWEDIYNRVIFANGSIHLLYFVLVVFFGSFYLVNLMLAVVAMAYETEVEATQKEMQLDKEYAEELKDAQADGQPRVRKVKKKRIITRRGAITLTDPISDTELDANELPRATETKPNAFPAHPPQPPPSLMDENERPGTTLDGGPNEKRQNPKLSTQTDIPNVPYSRYNTAISNGSLKRTNRNVNNSSLRKHISAKIISKTTTTCDCGLEKRQNSIEGNENPENGEIKNKMSPPALLSRDSAASTGTNTYQLALSELHRLAPSLDEEPLSQKPNVVQAINPLPDRNCKCCSIYCMKFRWWLKFQKVLYFIVTDPLVELFITSCIIFNTIFLAIEHHGMSPGLKEVLSIGNKVFTSIFTIETTLKLLAMSKEYFKNSWNVFDLVIVVFSLLELGLENINGLSVLRALRLLRVFKLAQSWTTMRVLLSIIVSTLGALGNLTLVLVIIMYIFAIMGMQLFGSNYVAEKFDDHKIPRWNFTDFVHSFMMIFRVLCGEWVEPLWDCMLTSGEWCMAIFLPSLVVGNFMVLNLFLALLLSSFNSDELSPNKKDEEASRLLLGIKRLQHLFCCVCEIAIRRRRERSQSAESIISSKPDVIVKPDVVPDSGFANRVHPESPLKSANTRMSESRQQMMNVVSIEEVQDETEMASRRVTWSPVADYVDNLRHGSMESLNINDTLLKVEIYGASRQDVSIQTAADSPSRKSKLSRSETKASNIVPREAPVVNSAETEIDVSSDEMEEETKVIPLSERNPEDCFPHWMYKKCCCCKYILTSKLAETWFQFRKKVIQIVDHWLFEWGIIVIIFASSICLCFEDIYLDDNEPLKEALYYLNLIFCIIYTIEMLLKWLAHGFVVYFSSGWSTLDFIIVAASILSVVVEGNKNLVALRSVRTLRALRPLRAISRWQGMRIVVNALMSAIPAIFNVLLVCIVFWLIFSIMGVQFFAGRFYKCVNSDDDRLPTDEVKNRSECEAKNYTWKNEDINFDNVGQGYLALFQVATFEGWMEVMEAAVDSTGIDQQPELEANLPAYLYFIIFIVCGSFFTLNLFIGVIIDNFNMLKKKYEGGVLNMFLTENQKNYYAAMKKLGRKKPQKLIRRPINKCQAVFYDISMSRRFEMLVFFIIVLNMISMGIDHYQQSKEFDRVLEILNISFTSLFVLEAVIKIIGLRQYYFTIPWNVFDFILVLSSIGGILLKNLTTNFVVSPTMLRVVRVFRIGRILRLIKAAKGIRKLLFALVVSLPALFNIGALIFLIMFIYAIIGMSLFSHVKHGGVLNDVVNFETFGRSMLLLFRLLTSAGWNDVLEPLMVQPPDCEPDKGKHPNGDCGNATMSIVFLVSYVIINFMIIINMYIAVILENFNQAHLEEELGIVEDDLDMFYLNWAKYDPRASQFISFWELSDFVATLDHPLKIAKPNTITIASFNLPIAKGMKIHCLDILQALIKYVLGHVEETGDFKKLRNQMEEKFKKQFPTRKTLEMVTTTLQWKRYEFAARVVQRAYRNHTSKRRRQRDLDEGLRPGSRLGKSLRNISNYFSIPKTSAIGSKSRPVSAKSLHANNNNGTANTVFSIEGNT